MEIFVFNENNFREIYYNKSNEKLFAKKVFRLTTKTFIHI